jgi:hypothetical protein
MSDGGQDITNAIDAYFFTLILYDAFVGKSISPFPIRDVTLMKKSVSGVRPRSSDAILCGQGNDQEIPTSESRRGIGI